MIAQLAAFWRSPLRSHDITLIAIMGVLAACGLIYEYLLAHYAGRILGAVETTLYAMIGVMIVSMGIGAFYAKGVRCAFTGFAWLEIAIGLVGGFSVLLMAAVFSAAYILPTELQAVYGLDPTITVDGGIVQGFQRFADSMPFVSGFVLGTMVGMEIPLIARIRETLHGEHLVHNTGTVYGADYIGAGAGAAIWVFICLRLPIVTAAVGTATVNLLMGLVFLWRYQRYVRYRAVLWPIHAAVAGLLAVMAFEGQGWMQSFNHMLFRDRVIYTKVTPHQHLTLTQRQIARGLPRVHSLYINGHLQFASNDERIYHSMLTYPPLLASARRDRVLVIGGGDGLAVRDILRWEPQAVTLVDLDRGMIDLFAGRDADAPPEVLDTLVHLNGAAFQDPRVKVIIGDAFLKVEELVAQGRHYDTIIVDLPDPSHPNLSKLYSDYFYAKLGELLEGDGAIGIQSTSPYHARKAFLCIGKTLQAAGFTTEQYHANVPSFGEWGWTIGVKTGAPASARIAEVGTLPVEDGWVSRQQLLAAFVFSPTYYQGREAVELNQLGQHNLYHYHRDAWRTEQGVFFANNTELR
jgi:spermidine synthase